MRKIRKSSVIPKTLVNAPVPNCVDEVKPLIYKAEDVRNQLIEDQYSKCAYCECVIAKQYNDVEHYRPKSSYYWLGHNWENLLYACNLCNRTYKKDSFPIKDESARYDVKNEKPLIINPCIENPLDHIKFHRYIVVPRIIDGMVDIMGYITIKTFHLNDRVERPTLVYGRQEVYEQYERFAKLKKIAEGIIHSDKEQFAKQSAMEIVALCNQSIDKMMSPFAPFSGMLLGISHQQV